MESIPYSPVVVVAPFCSARPRSSHSSVQSASSHHFGQVASSPAHENYLVQPVHVHIQLTRSYLRSRSCSSNSCTIPQTTPVSLHITVHIFQYLSQMPAEILAPPFTQHTENQSFDSQTISSNYREQGKYPAVISDRSEQNPWNEW